MPRFETRICPLLPGETAARRLHQICNARASRTISQHRSDQRSSVATSVSAEPGRLTRFSERVKTTCLIRSRRGLGPVASGARPAEHGGRRRNLARPEWHARSLVPHQPQHWSPPQPMGMKTVVEEHACLIQDRKFPIFPVRMAGKTVQQMAIRGVGFARSP